jgi:hypothetical protein
MPDQLHPLWLTTSALRLNESIIRVRHRPSFFLTLPSFEETRQNNDAVSPLLSVEHSIAVAFRDWLLTKRLL